MSIHSVPRFGEKFWFAPAAIVALTLACGDDGNDGNSPGVGEVIESQTFEIGGTEQRVTLGKAGQAIELVFPAGVVPTPRKVTVRTSSGVMKSGARVVTPVVQIATRSLSFAMPVRARQSIVRPSPGKALVPIFADEQSATWMASGAARVLGDVGGVLTLETDVLGSGLWAIGEVDAMPDGGIAIDADAGVPSNDAGIADANVQEVDAQSPDANVVIGLLPQIESVSPTNATAGNAISLLLLGKNFDPRWQIYFGGQPLLTVIEGDSRATATVTAAQSINQGLIPIWLGIADQPSQTSNTLYLRIDPMPGVPVAVDYSPDNGLPGTRVLIIGDDFATEPFTIRDALGNVIPQGAIGTTTWVGISRNTVEFVVPANMPTGPLTLTNARGSYQGRIFNVGQNLSRAQNAMGSASSAYNNAQWSAASGWDNNLQTSWFTAGGDCATACQKSPWFKVTFGGLQPVRRIAMRGNREYPSGYDFLEGVFDLLGPGDEVLWSGRYALPAPDRDLDIVFPTVIPGAAAVRFTGTRDESSDPGFAELQAFSE